MSGSVLHVQESGMESRTVGFTYVLSNPAMPGMVKVSYTTALAEERVRELHPRDIPLPYAVEFEALTSFPEEVEARAHQMLGSHRVAKDREFFSVTPELAVEAVRDAMLDAAGLGAWSAGKVHQVRDGDRIALTVQEGDMFVVLAYPSRAAERAVALDLWQAHSDGDLLELTAGDAPGPAGLSDHDIRAELDPVPPLERDETRPNGVTNGREQLVPGDRLLWLRPTADGRSCKRTAFEFSAFCQVVSRTWTPKFTADGMPLILEYPAASEQPACVVESTMDALALPRPRAWAPREPDPEDAWLAVAAREAPPDVRLAQLGKRRQSRTRSAAANRVSADQLPLW
jgi:T5orf172 domain